MLWDDTAGWKRPGAIPALPSPRRLLAIGAVTLCLLGILIGLAAPPAVVLQPAAPQHGAPQPSNTVPLQCINCAAPLPPWMPSSASPLIATADGTLRVDPRQIGAAATEPPPDRRIGIVQAFTAPYAASYAGAGWERIYFDWGSLYPDSPDRWNPFAIPDSILSREIASGREIVGLLMGHPRWAFDAQGFPRGLYLPPDDPRNAWGHFVAQVVRRYHNRVHHWIIWNEPDVWKPHVAGWTWPGTVDQFVRLQKVAYLQIKAVDPAAVVHLAATTYWWDAAYGRPLYFGRLLDALRRDPEAAAHHYYFDVATAHIYNVPDDVERILLLDRQLMRERGIDKPIWLVETNGAPTRDGPWSMVDPPSITTARENMAFIPAATALAIAAGAERVSFYKMADDTHLSPRAYPSGILRPDGTARPALAAIRATTHALAGWVRATDLGTHGGVRAVAVDRGARGGTLVVWTAYTFPTPVTISVDVPPHVSAQWLSAHIVIVNDDDTYLARPPQIAGTHALYHVVLAPRTCLPRDRCNIDGAPIMVVAPSMPRLANPGS